MTRSIVPALLPVLLSVAAAIVPAVAQPATQQRALTVGDNELASLSSQCGPFFYWSSDSSHFHVLLISTTGRYAPVASGDHPALVIDGEFLVEPQVADQRQFDSALELRDPFAILHAHARWETRYLARQKGWDSIGTDLLISMPPPEAPVPSEIRLLTYEEPVTLLGQQVDRALLGTALIGDHVLVIAMPIMVGEDTDRPRTYLTGVLEAVTAHGSRASLQGDLRSIQTAIAAAKDCSEMIRMYQAARSGEK